jgi:hypothetical protein
MTQVGEGIAVTQVKDPEEDHWAQLEYTYPDGSPVQGMFTAVDGSGMTWTSYLNDLGQACLSGLPPGMVEYQLLPSDSLKDELQDLRTQIQKVLDDIIEEQRAEAKAHQNELDKQSHLGKVLSYHAAVRRGFWNGAVGLLTFAKDVVVKASEIAAYLSPVTRLNNLLQASYTSYRNGELNPAQWRESLAKNYQEEEFKDLADLLGIDIRNLEKDEVLAIFTEAYETVAHIADDPEFRDMFIQFGKDYAGAQSSIEWAEFAGGGLFEIVLTALLLAFTGGLGNAAQIASKVRHAARLRTLGGMLRKLGRLLKRKKLSQKTKSGVDSKHKVTAEKPEGPKLGEGISEPLASRPKTNPKDIRLAAKSWPSEKQARFNLADNYYYEAGYRDYDSHLRGIDFDYPVDIVEIKKGEKVYQYSYLDRITGEPKVGSYYYSDKSVDVNKLGFDVGSRKMIEVELEESGSFLRSRAANIEDWNGSDAIYPGGETQLFNPNASLSNVRVVN